MAGGTIRRGPTACSGDARLLQIGSVRMLSPPIWTSTVECPTHVAVRTPVSARGDAKLGVALGSAPAGGGGPGVPEAPVGCTMIHAVRYTVHACPVTPVSLRLPATAARGFSRSQIFVEMLRASHADECGADDRQRPHKGDGALRNAAMARNRLMEFLRKVCGKPGLEKRGTRDDRDAQCRGGFEQGNAFAVELLRGRADRFRERQVDGQLHDAEVVCVAPDLACERDEVGELEMIACVRRHPEPIPRGAAEDADLTLVAPLLEKLEGAAQAFHHHRAGEGLELLLGVVDVVHVYGVQPEIRAAPLQLRREVGWRDTVPPRTARSSARPSARSER